MLPLSQNNFLLLSTCKGVELINISSIVRVEAISNYSKLFFINGNTLVVAKVLRWFEQALFTAEFVRVHRTHLVNKHFIHQYITSEGVKIQLTTGDWVEVSRRKKASVVQSLYTRAA